MKHARPDYDRIQDPAGLIPDNEPVFLLRGQDRYAWRAVQHYAETVRDFGGDPEIVRLSFEQAAKMQEYAISKGLKSPDLPASPKQASDQ